MLAPRDARGATQPPAAASSPASPSHAPGVTDVNSRGPGAGDTASFAAALAG